MSTELDTRTDHVTGLSTIEGIDLDLEVKCVAPMHRGHDHRADIIVRVSCPGCEVRNSAPLCRKAWASYGITGARCDRCSWGGERDDAMWVVETLR